MQKKSKNYNLKMHLLKLQSLKKYCNKLNRLHYCTPLQSFMCVFTYIFNTLHILVCFCLLTDIKQHLRVNDFQFAANERTMVPLLEGVLTLLYCVVVSIYGKTPWIFTKKQI